jgi:ribosomal protein S18 acetylase RimI-like enzyme
VSVIGRTATSSAARLRRAKVDDALALSRLEKRAFIGYYAGHRFTQKQFRYYLARSTTMAHVIEADGQILAYSLGVEGTEAGIRVARLHSIAVEPTTRKRRLGKRLLHAFVTEARRRQCRAASLEVAVENGPARRLFEGSHFESVAHLLRYYSPSTDGLRMKRRLDKAGRIGS